VRNTGVEGTVTATVVESKPVTWGVSVNVSINHNTLVSLAPGVPAQIVSGVYAELRQVVGYPLYGTWAQRVAYADVNHDGVIEPTEVAVADSASFMGPSLPTREASVATHVALWGGAITVSGLLDYRGGYRIANAVAYQAASGAQNERAENDPTAPLWLQARSVAAYVTPCCNMPASFVEDGTFARLRELSVTYMLPSRLVRVARVQSLSVTGAVRNLALWTRYTGVDPEVSNTNFNNVQTVPTANASVINNDIRGDYGAVPLARYVVVRLNVGL
jgi:hypothetical protein